MVKLISTVVLLMLFPICNGGRNLERNILCQQSEKKIVSNKLSECVYPGWKEGELDIHHIYTGRGESNFLIFPDGTSMLVDAGDWDPDDYTKMCKQLPNDSLRAGEWIARYIRRMNPKVDVVDYLIVSHFHNDHIGDSKHLGLHITSNRKPNYVLTGVTEVGEMIRFKKVLDRGYPNYLYPIPIRDPDVDNYLKFIEYNKIKYGLQQEKFVVGRCDQISLEENKIKYPMFSIQNIAANGEVWLGTEEKTISYYDLNFQNKKVSQNENTKSLVLLVSYGDFKYYTGGDLSGSLFDSKGNLVNLEEVVAKVCGQVDVCKANHHGYSDAMTEGFVRSICAKQYIIPVWDYEHIQPSVLKRIINAQVDKEIKIFFTEVPLELRNKYQGEEWMKFVAEENGHIIVKVYNNGSKYKIYILSAENEKNQVKAVYGPFDAY